MSPSDEIASLENVETNNDSVLNGMKKKPINFRTEMLKGVHSPSDVLSPFSQKISLERNSALKNFKPKSLMDRLLGVKSQLGETSVKEVIAQPEPEPELAEASVSDRESLLEQEQVEENDSNKNKPDDIEQQ